MFAKVFCISAVLAFANAGLLDYHHAPAHSSAYSTVHVSQPIAHAAPLLHAAPVLAPAHHEVDYYVSLLGCN